MTAFKPAILLYGMFMSGYAFGGLGMRNTIGLLLIGFAIGFLANSLVEWSVKRRDQ